MMPPIRLEGYDNGWYNPGRGLFVRAIWLLICHPMFSCSLLPVSAFRVLILRLFGAKIGRGVVIRSGVQVKYPWHLVVGDHCWIGEHVWIDNLTTITLGSSVCLSQGAYLCTGNHDWKDPFFGLITQPIHLADGAWAAAKSVLLPGTMLEEGAVAATGSVVTGRIPAFEIYGGNPAFFLRNRKMHAPGMANELQSEEIE